VHAPRVQIAESVQEGLVEAKRLEAMQKELQQLEHRKQTLPAEIARAIEDETVKRESIKAMESEVSFSRPSRGRIADSAVSHSRICLILRAALQCAVAGLAANPQLPDQRALERRLHVQAAIGARFHHCRG
jgi:hypothetical protein